VNRREVRSQRRTRVRRIQGEGLLKLHAESLGHNSPDRKFERRSNAAAAVGRRHVGEAGIQRSHERVSATLGVSPPACSRFTLAQPVLDRPPASGKQAADGLEPIKGLSKGGGDRSHASPPKNGSAIHVQQNKTGQGPGAPPQDALRGVVAG